MRYPRIMKTWVPERFERYWTPEPFSGCWLWTGALSKYGYGRCHIYKHRTHAHRLSWTIYRGKIEDDICVLHRCDTRSCVNPNHLFLGTKDDNNKDRAKKGRNRDQRGTKNSRCRLTEDQVRAIRNDSRTQIVIASEYNISRSNVGIIKQRQAWRHVL